MSAVEKTQAAWDGHAPDWVIELAKVCDQRSQAAAAADIGYSPAVVNRVLKRLYTGRYDAVKQAVTGAYMDATVTCPVLGELPSNQCLEIQRQPYAPTNAQRVRLYKACRTCQNNVTRGETQ